MPIIELSTFQYVFAFFAFFLGGLVKGTVGMGMKAITLGLLATVVSLPVAIALLIVPGLTANAWQVVGGGAPRQTLRRIWPLLAACCIGVWLGAEVLVVAETRLLTIGLGILLGAYAAYGLIAPHIPTPGRHEIWMSPTIGGLNGLAAGMTGSDVIPGVPYLQAMGLPREELVQAMGLLFLTASIAIAFAFQNKGLLDGELAVSSVVSAIPALSGYWFGAKIRRRIAEAQFRRVILVSLLILGSYIVVRNVI
ncbi:MAG: sulfite exporter TauE/SafE family protein [Alphaproteobacteria bacterium]|nr:sulfite exporter TauE/SafE family protein [Alphaproteobacteria bacterium]